MQKRAKGKKVHSIAPRISHLWTLDDEIHFASMWKGMIQVTNDELFDLYLRNPPFLEATVKVFSRKPVGNNDTLTLEMDNFTFRSVGSFFLKRVIPDAIPDDDHAKLVWHNTPTVCEIFESSLLVHPEDGVQDMSDLLNQLHARNRDKSDVQEVIDKFNAIDISGEDAVNPIDYDVLHTDTMQVEDRETHRAKSRRIRHLARLDPEGRTDVITICLLSALVMLSTHEVSLAKSRTISRLQDHYGVLLLRYLKAKLGSKGTRKFCEIVGSLPLAYELGRMRVARMERMQAAVRSNSSPS